MAFIAFMLATLTLFVRPTEIVPELLGLPIYNILVSTSLALTFSGVIAQFQSRSLAESPISACVLGLALMVVVSHVGHGNLTYARMMGFEFAKIALYYYLLLALLDSPERFRAFLVWVGVMVITVSALSLLSYYDMIQLHGVEAIERLETNATTGEVYFVRQLQGSGIFADPNDLCLMLVTGMGIACYLMTEPGAGPVRVVWAGALGLFGYVLLATYSRGGFLALLAGLTALLQGKWGSKKTAVLTTVLVPLAIVLVGGRQANIDTSTGSGQSRIQLWAASLTVLRHQPLFGVGQGLLADEIGQESHNTFIHCFADMGFFGGVFFLGVYLNALKSLRRLDAVKQRIADPEFRRVLPYLSAIVTGYSAGMFSVSRAYIVPTYMVPGLVAAYARLATEGWAEPLDRFDARHLSRLVLASGAFILGLYVLLPFFTRWG